MPIYVFVMKRVNCGVFEVFLEVGRLRVSVAPPRQFNHELRHVFHVAINLFSFKLSLLHAAFDAVATARPNNARRTAAR